MVSYCTNPRGLGAGMGIAFLPHAQNNSKKWEKWGHSTFWEQNRTQITWHFRKKGMANRPSPPGSPGKIPHKKEAYLSRGKSPPGGQHPHSATHRAFCDVRLPDGPDQLRHGHPRKPLPEALAPLEGEDKLQVPGL